MKKLGICVLTLPCRIDKFSNLLKELTKQVINLNLQHEVQILYLGDTKDYQVGTKRNILLQMCTAEYVCFIDDDDFITKDYISGILRAIKTSPDAVGFKGKYLLNDKDIVINDIPLNYNGENTYFRMINHLTPIKTQIAKSVNFPSKNYGEDDEFQKRIKPFIKKVEFIDKYLYIYDFNEQKSQTIPKNKNNAYED